MICDLISDVLTFKSSLDPCLFFEQMCLSVSSNENNTAAIVSQLILGLSADGHISCYAYQLICLSEGSSNFMCVRLMDEVSLWRINLRVVTWGHSKKIK